MEDEAKLDDGHLRASVGIRRRSTSVSEDYSVQKTNDDASECKYSAVKLKYWEDEFLNKFVHSLTPSELFRDPEISRGYWARVSAITSIVKQFVEKVGSSAQIVNLGCGFDTLYWRLKKEEKKFYVFVDVDFSSVTARKIKQIRKPGTPDLTAMFSEPISEDHHTDLHCGDYHLVGADIRQTKELHQKLMSTGIDFTQPTLFISECVLVYMTTAQSSFLLKELGTWFSTASFVNYEQVHMNDVFGKVMLDNLQKRGIGLLGLSACEDLDTQRTRFLSNGWTDASAWTMNDVYSKLDAEEVKRIENLQMLDEVELLSQLLDHYCLVYATKDSSESHANLRDISPR
uniref:Leucine carboxyl methyltransferase 1 n=1 Tax=Steinernema glaseri TaxID=37863 RepID=A0A1I8ATA8_9BILA